MMKLFEEFEPISFEMWLEKATNDLKGSNPLEKYKKDFNALISQSPYYDQSSIGELQNQTVAHLIARSEYDPWYTTERIDVIDERKSNQLAISALQNGCNGITFNIVNENCDLNILLKDISLAHCYVSFENQEESSIDKFISDYLTQHKDSTVNISIIRDLESPEMLNSISRLKKPTGYRDISLVLKDRDTSTVPANIASLLSHFVDIICKSNEENIQNLYDRLIVTNHCTDHYFYEISKIRALRLLFNEVAAYFNINSPAIFIQSETVTSEEELQNLLSNSTQAMSAVIGGTDSLIVNSHLSNPDGFSKRVARNVSSLLWEESRLDKVKDPIAGSYYITQLTEQIVNESWNKFIEIETLGGFSKRNERIA